MNYSIENLHELVSALTTIKKSGHKFVSMVHKTKDGLYQSNTYGLGASYSKAMKFDLKQLTQKTKHGSVNTTKYSDVDFQKAYRKAFDSLYQRVNGTLENGSIDSNVKSRSNAQTDAYQSIAPFISKNENTGDIYLSGAKLGSQDITEEYLIKLEGFSESGAITEHEKRKSAYFAKKEPKSDWAKARKELEKDFKHGKVRKYPLRDILALKYKRDIAKELQWFYSIQEQTT